MDAISPFAEIRARANPSGWRWLAEHSDYVKAEWLKGTKVADIVTGLQEKFGAGYSIRAISRRAERMGLKPRLDYTTWSQEHKDELVKLYADRSSGSGTDIAIAINKKFGTSYTRCSISSQISRMGLKGRPSARPLRRDYIARPKVEKPKARPKPEPRPSAEIIRLRCVEVQPRNLTFDELEARDCRYVTDGDTPETYRFCGNKTMVGYSYCWPHKNLCWVPPLPRRVA